MVRYLLITVITVLVSSLAGAHGTEKVWGRPDPGPDGGFTWWTHPFDGLNGTGSLLQALIIDPGWSSIKVTGEGRDPDGGIWNGDCSTVSSANAHPCPLASHGYAKEDLLLSGLTAGSADDRGIIFNGLTSPGMPLLCRNTTTFEHGTGVGYDYFNQLSHHASPFVIRDDGGAGSADVYRYFAGDMGGGMPGECATVDSSIFVNARSGNSFAVSTLDDAMIAYIDGTARSPYGARFIAQYVLLSVWEEQYPEVLGVTNMTTNGYQETDCTGGSGHTITGTKTAADSPQATQDGTGTQFPLFGLGCNFSGAADTLGEIELDGVPVTVGEYYMGSVYISGNHGTGAIRSKTVSLVDNAGNDLAAANVQWWIKGPTTGHVLMAIEDADPSAVVGDTLSLLSRTYHGGVRLYFAFTPESGDTSVGIKFIDTAPSATNAFAIDEYWVREKIWKDLEKHYIIPDGRTSITLVTDGVDLEGTESIVDAFDFMLGYTSPFEPVADPSIRPDLYLDVRPSERALVYPGVDLGDIVGAKDGYQDILGSAIPFAVRDSITSPGWCILDMGFYDATVPEGAGGGSRPSSAAEQSDPGNEELYFIDQIRGFEQAARKLLLLIEFRSDKQVRKLVLRCNGGGSA
jgi:hypothetical protein